jgi:hypothetical protein
LGIPIVLQHLAASAILRLAGDRKHEAYMRAARLLGYVDARFAALEFPREYTERQECEKMLPALYEALGADTAEKLMQEGGAWSEDHACVEAMLL